MAEIINIICINLCCRIHLYFHLIKHCNLLRLMMNESEGYPQYYDYPDWPETQELESVPGFGFLPVGVNKELDMMTQVTSFFLFYWQGRASYKLMSRAQVRSGNCFIPQPTPPILSCIKSTMIIFFVLYK